MRRVPCRCVGFAADRVDEDNPRVISTVSSLSTLAPAWRPDCEYLVPVIQPSEASAIEALVHAGLGNVTPLIPDGASASGASWKRYVTATQGAFEPGDIVALEPGAAASEVILRRSDMHHTVFLTNRCNSRCVMCSQPPTPQDDDWRIEEALQVARHLTWSPSILGFTGGEPLLLGTSLRRILEHYATQLPATQFDVLTNGRMADDQTIARNVLQGLRAPVTWMVPLYGHAPFLHDYVAQAEGAFDQTIGGLLNLQRHAQPIQLRIVLIRPVLEVLPALADFIARNLPFVREVALMACEPVGFALAHREDCEVDLLEWKDEIRAAMRCLRRAALPVVIMNAPRCALDSDLWPLAVQSISDWKRVYAKECAYCKVRDECCGLFARHERGWAPTEVRPISLQESDQQVAS